ncbi:integrase [Nocardiopsis mwathae]|uniref:Integrase n=1 Tax=Nocardiopsis mwathae TaxID=1472723 RepID=A0A7X0D7P6_9ACTN|nr:tyrosine-type recombinase/integrase [Nocardiopsis mwathae]MBB6174693.1 integrase [Nocardiopsis mwathae]
MLDVFARTGLRYGELTTLQVRDITIHHKKTPDGRITRYGFLQAKRAWKHQKDNTFKLGPPKTKQSRRRIVLSSATVEALLPRLDDKKPDEFVFTTESGAWWRHSSVYNRRWVPAVKRAMQLGLRHKPRIHGLRPTRVAWLIDGNIHPFKIQRRLGHMFITTMDRYGHLMTDIDDELLEAIDGTTPPPPALAAEPTDAGVLEQGQAPAEQPKVTSPPDTAPPSSGTNTPAVVTSRRARQLHLVV